MTSPPVYILTVLGALTVLLGFFAAGNMLIVIVGLVALVAAGVIDLLGRRR